MIALARRPCFFVAAACLGMAGCASGPTGERARIVEIPLVSAYSDIAFTVTSGARQGASCIDDSACPSDAPSASAVRFARQVQRIAAVLQSGAQQLYPDLALRVPGLIDSRFDVYVVEGDEAGSASSANGRIALNAALGTWQPFDEWVAFVIAREMGHVIARHHAENSAASIAMSVILNLILPGSGLLKSAVSAGGSGMAAASKRDVQALEADAIALSLLKAGGFGLHEVSLSLLIAPVAPEQSTWSKDFRRSSDDLLAEVRKAELAIASVTPAPQDRQGADPRRASPLPLWRDQPQGNALTVEGVVFTAAPL